MRLLQTTCNAAWTRQKPDIKVSMLEEIVAFFKCSNDPLNINRDREDAAPRGLLLRLLTSQLGPGQLPQTAVTTLAPNALRLTGR